MKILHTVEFYAPSVGGSQEVVKQLSERMVEAGHEVTVATSYLPDRTHDILNGVKIRSFDISGNEVRGYKGNIKQYQQFLLDSDFDVLMNYAAQQWTADLSFSLLDAIKAKKIFVPCGFSGLHDPDYQKYFKKMPEILNKYDATVYLSNDYRDINFARDNNINNTHIIPNGADEKEFLSPKTAFIRKKISIGESTSLILHVGSFTGVKGQAEAIDIFESANLNDAALLLIGNIADKKLVRKLKQRAWWYNLKPENRASKRKICIRHFNRDDTVAALKAADLFLFPSNIEASPLVLFEACAAQTPFLTTDVGNAAEIIKWTGAGSLLPTKKDRRGYSYPIVEKSALMLRDLIKNSSKRKAMAKAGFQAWDKKYRWDKIAQQYLRIYGVKK